MTLIVCGLADVAGLIAARRPSHMVTLLDPASMIGTPPGLAADRHLRLPVNDIAEPTDGMVLPTETLVADLLAFGRAWDEAAPMIVHCWAGISRSTASAFVLACERNPEADETAIARALRQAAPHASPNRRIVALADDLLARGGRMVDAVEAMGDYDHMVARPFDFAVRF
ncbi:MAG: tyrosine phosphatase family protein [Phenylobacterium sp.]|uniref:tyrosine phosphatase family protein n=1 Tax=Phenylobacterium sp. TaxID=1871053 RepID=UPI00391A5D40